MTADRMPTILGDPIIGDEPIEIALNSRNNRDFDATCVHLSVVLGEISAPQSDIPPFGQVRGLLETLAKTPWGETGIYCDVDRAAVVSYVSGLAGNLGLKLVKERE